MLRFALLIVTCAALAFSACVFEAASKTRGALELIASARAVEEPLHAQMLSGAAQSIEQSWARPALWRADAAEALSAIYALQAQAASGDRALYQRSVEQAAMAVRLAPVQPQAWARLAAFAQMGLPNVPCKVAACLAMSWRAAKMTDPQTGCARLQIADAAGLLSPGRDERIVWYVRSGVGREDIARCLTFLPPPARFQYLLEAR